MTLDELSLKSGVSKSILSQIERDLSNPTVTTISRIAEALDEKLSDFFLKIEVEETNSIESSKETPSITSKDGLCELNILGAGETVNWLQWYILEMKPKGILDSGSHGPKTFENLLLISFWIPNPVEIAIIITIILIEIDNVEILIIGEEILFLYLLCVKIFDDKKLSNFKILDISFKL